MVIALVQRVSGLVTGVTAYISLRYLVRYSRIRTHAPFAIYCPAAGFASIMRFTAL